MAARALILVGLVAIACAAVPGDARAQSPFMADVLGLPDQRVEYPSHSSTRGPAASITVAGVGDVSGDGREDFAVGVGASPPSYASRVHVSFSGATAGGGNAGGFQIATTSFGYSLSSAGDVDGDGLGDIAFLGYDRVTVVFGRLDGATVDTAQLGKDGFEITGAYTSASSGNGVTLHSFGLALLGDVGGDGIADLIVRTRTGAAIVHPPRDAAGRRFDVSLPGPHVSLIASRAGYRLDQAFVDALGDVDGDGRADALVAGDSAAGGQAAYGVSAPAPGTTTTLPDAVAQGHAFAIHTDDVQLTQAVGLGDQNADGVRDVGLVCAPCTAAGGTRLRVVYTAPFGTTVDARSLYASDGRGWSMQSVTPIVDVGDQSGDGVGDHAVQSSVVFPDPPRETGTREARESGFSFGSSGGNIVASIGDLNGDGRRELLRASHSATPDDGVDPTVSYVVTVDDSAADPAIALPDVAVSAYGTVTADVVVDPGAGSRGGALPLRVQLEVASPTGESVVYERLGDPGIVAARGATYTAYPARGLGLPAIYGGTFRIRGLASNGRGPARAGPWRSFVYDVAPPPAWGEAPPAPAATPPAVDSRIRIGARPLRLLGGRIAVRVSCRGATSRCRGTLHLRRGALRVGSRAYSVAAGRSATVQVPVRKAARRALRGKRRASVKLTAKPRAGSAGGTRSTTATRVVRLR